MAQNRTRQVLQPQPSIAYPPTLMQEALSYERELLRIAESILDEPERANDVVQEVYIDFNQTYVHNGASNPIRDSLRALLGRMTQNKAIRLRGMLSARPEVSLNPAVHEMSTDDRSTLERMITSENVIYIINLINDLPPSLRDAFKMIYIRGLSYAEASHASGKSVPALQTAVCLAKKTLRKKMNSTEQCS